MAFIKALWLSVFITGLLCNAWSQCTVNSSGCGGYTVTVSINATAISPSSYSCTYGYNYNVVFNYSITVSGTNSCYNGNVQIQPLIFCNGGQSNGYYSISVPAPTVGTPSTHTYTGTLTTTTNPYTGASNCTTATPTSLGCNSLQININAPGISSSGASCGNAVLPIGLILFTGQCVNKSVVLEWTTATEKDNKYFSIERSTDGEHWELMKTVNGAGNSTTLLNYSWADSSATGSGTYYYQLKQTDYDGQTTTQNVIAVEGCALNDALLTIYPNPSKGVFNFVVSNYAAGEYVEIYNAIGQLVAKQQLAAAQSVIDITGQQTGLYLCRLLKADGTTVTSQRLMLGNAGVQ